MPRLAKPVILPPADASAPRAIVKRGTHKSRKIARARALLAMRSGQAPKVTPALEARITSLACGDLPAGAARRARSLLNENRVSLDYGPAVSRETIRQVLKKASSSPG